MSNQTMNIVYQEEVLANWVLKGALLSSVFILFCLLLIDNFFVKIFSLNSIAKVAIGLVMFIDFGIFWFFRKLNIVVTDQLIIFGFGLFKKKYRLADILAVTVSEYKFSNYLGYGIRIGLDKTIGYVPKGGLGVRISFNGEKKDYFLASDQPEQLKKILMNYVSKK